MPALNYMPQFAPFILDGTKQTTIRKRRKYPPRSGQTLFHYTGQRTGKCRKLRETSCLDVRSILIGRKGQVWLFEIRLTDDEYDAVYRSGDPKVAQVGFRLLNDRQKNHLAWNDGFRPDKTGGLHTCPTDSWEKYTNSFELMFRWFQRTHGLPFIGDWITWIP